MVYSENRRDDELVLEIPDDNIDIPGNVNNEFSVQRLNVGGVCVHHLNTEIGQILKIESHGNHEEQLLKLKRNRHTTEMYFNMGGSVKISTSDSAEVLLSGMQHNLIATSGPLTSSLSLHGRPPFKLLNIRPSGVYLSKWYQRYKRHVFLNEFVKRAYRDKVACLYKRSPEINHAMGNILHKIDTCRYSGFEGNEYLEAQVRLLLVELLQLPDTQSLLSEGMLENKTLSHREINMIREAKAYIEHHPTSRISVKELAHYVGTNEFKLKKGFREWMGCSIFKYESQVRMKSAHDLLARGCKSISEVADIMGYSNQANFTNAFKAYFGYTPGSLEKKHRNRLIKSTAQLK